MDLPDVRDHAVEVPRPGSGPTEARRRLGQMLRDLVAATEQDRNFRIFGPDETRSNRLGDVFDVTGSAWQAAIEKTDQDLARDGRVMEVLSEHLCQGWLEGYLLTGRHGLFSCYEAFTHIIDSMVSQHIKWLKVSRDIDLPDLAVRVVNVVDLMRLQPEVEHPHGLSDREFDTVFTTDRPIVFAYHGYPMMIHKLTYRRTNHGNLHVRGYKEEGTTTTPFDMVMLNDLDRYHLVMDVVDRVPGLGSRAAGLRQLMVDARLEARAHTRATGEDLAEVTDWTWPGEAG